MQKDAKKVQKRCKKGAKKMKKKAAKKAAKKMQKKRAAPYPNRFRSGNHDSRRLWSSYTEIQRRPDNPPGQSMPRTEEPIRLLLSSLTPRLSRRSIVRNRVAWLLTAAPRRGSSNRSVRLRRPEERYIMRNRGRPTAR
jgi:hypothetical protein